MEAVNAMVYNVIHGTFKVKRELVDGMRSHRKQLYNIVDKKISLVKRKKAYDQKITGVNHLITSGCERDFR